MSTSGTCSFLKLSSILIVLFCGENNRYLYIIKLLLTGLSSIPWLPAILLSQAFDYEDYEGERNHFDRLPPRTDRRHSPGTCVCRPLSECPYFAVFPASPTSRCGFNRFEVFVCCPHEDMESRRRRDEQEQIYRQQHLKHSSRRHHHDQDWNYNQPMETPWVWDVEPIRPKGDSEDNLLNHWESFRFERPVQDTRHHTLIEDEQIDEYHRRSEAPNHHKHWVFHFEDPNTLLNCPPSISEEFPIPQHLAHADTVVSIPAGHDTSAGSTSLPPPEETTPKPATTESPSINTDKPDSTSPNESLINLASCGISINNRIIGGEDAAPMQFPWMARLAYRNLSKF